MDKKTVTIKAFADTYRAIIARGFCADEAAKDAKGNAIKSTEPDAVQWCFIGAEYRAMHELSIDGTQLFRPDYQCADTFMERLRDVMFDRIGMHCAVAYALRYPTQKAALEIVDAAIDRLKKEGLYV